MKRVLLLFILFLGIVVPAFSQKAVYRKVADTFAKSRVHTFDLFRLASNDINARYTSKDSLLKLEINSSIFEAIKNQKPELLSFSIPQNNGQNVTVDLMSRTIHSLGFTIIDAKNKKIQLDQGLYYSGMVRGNENSLVSLSFSENTLGGFISDESGNYELTSIDDQYALVNSRSGAKFFCDGQDEPQSLSLKHEEVMTLVSTNDYVSCRAVEIYLEADHTLFSSFGNITETMDYVNRLFVQVATLFENENIEIRMSKIKVWDSPDPYVEGRSNSFDLLGLFARQMEKGFEGDLAHLLTKSRIGGRAHVTVLCNSNPAVRTGVSGSLIDDILSVPLFSHDVTLLAHELGHNFGSPHTQSCYWDGGPIDNCVAPEGDCSASGAAPINGGTIMSYCGNINLAHGFGELPGNLIRLYTRLCMGSKPVIENLKVAEVYDTQVYLTWNTKDKYEHNFEVEFKEDNSNQWITIQTINQQIKLTNLKPNTKYQWRVKTLCSDYAIDYFQTSSESGYCDTEYSHSNCENSAGIENVFLNYEAISYGMFCSSRSYTFHFDKIKNLTIGKTQNFSVDMEYEQYNTYLTIWIDYNNNRVFEKNEIVYTSPDTYLKVLNGEFLIDSTILPVSKVRMRIVTSVSGQPLDPCGDYFIGEVQDFYVNLINCDEEAILPANVSIEKVTANRAQFTWDNLSVNSELLVEYRQKGSGQWLGYWTVKNGIHLSVSPNVTYEWRVSRFCSDYLTGEFKTPKDEYCNVDYQYPFNCSSEYGIEKITIHEPSFIIPGLCSSDGTSFYSDKTLELVAGNTYSFSLDFKPSYLYLYASIWIDSNGNGRFERNELVYSSYLPDPNGQSGNFTLPSYLSSVKETRMRVRISTNGYQLYPCSEDYQGQTKDLLVNINSNCEAYVFEKVMIEEPTACTNGKIELLLNQGHEIPTTLNYTINGVFKQFKGMIKYSSISLPDPSPGNYMFQSFTIGDCEMNIGANVTLKASQKNEPIASNTGPYLVDETINLSVDTGQYFFWEGPNEFYSFEQNPKIENASLLNSGIYRVRVENIDNCYTYSTTEVVVNPVLAKEIDNIQISVYPNPAQNQVSVKVNFEGESQATLFSADGKELNSFKFDKNTVINTEKIGSGLFIIKVMNEGREVSGKIVIQ